jgi:Domain of unknown function (DUF4389)
MPVIEPVDEHDHPVRLVVEDDLHRSRLTVFFRLILAIPHFIWYVLWSIAAVIAAIVNWFATLLVGRPPSALHRFLSAYVRYTVHLGAYLYLVANPYPGFVGAQGSYPVDVVLPTEPQAQARWKTLLRLILALPAFVLAALLGGGLGFSFNFFVSGGSGRRRSSSRYSGFGGGGGLLAGISALLGWFASLVLGAMPRGLRDAGAYGIGYGAQVRAYALVLTDRYPSTDPTALLVSVPPPPEHPVHLVGDAHDLRRSRLTVFFRLPLVIPHIVWLYLWTVVALLASIVNWFATLAVGVPPRALHRFICRYVRYQLHVYAFGSLAANPFPGFTGAAGTYPLDLVLPEEPQRQNRWKTAFRVILAVPAWIVAAALTYTLYACAFFTWFVALLLGSAPWGLRNLSAYALRYSAQLNAYVYLVTDRYPHASPLEGEAEPEQLELEPVVA